MRLTEKYKINEWNYVIKEDIENKRYVCVDLDAFMDAGVKLGQLEDIEEEFEIDDLEDLRERLTMYKFLANHEMSCVDVNAYNLMLKDLNEYHKIEEKLGIDLVTFFRIRKHCYDKKPIFYKKNNKIIESNTMVDCDYSRVSIMLEEFKYLMFPFKKYGKTWALTKEELL